MEILAHRVADVLSEVIQVSGYIEYYHKSPSDEPHPTSKACTSQQSRGYFPQSSRVNSTCQQSNV